MIVSFRITTNVEISSRVITRRLRMPRAASAASASAEETAAEAAAASVPAVPALVSVVLSFVLVAVAISAM